MYKVAASVNEGLIEGTIKNLREENNKVLFYLVHCNLMDVNAETGEADNHESKLPCQASGMSARIIREKFKDGDLVRMNYFISQSSNSRNIKLKVRFIVPAIGIYKTEEELHGVH